MRNTDKYATTASLVIAGAAASVLAIIAYWIITHSL